MTRRDLASERQMRAATPTQSTWLSANAGSGKTKVLTDRVARLLLAGTEPQKILCLTYTKAAAAEMQNRLLKRLGAWAMREDAALRSELQELGEDGPISAERLAQARRLFAKAIETPGGLKIQTIHSFCAALLRRFPLEAGVPHGFTEMDDRAAALLRADVLEDIAAGPDRPCLDALAQKFTGADIQTLLAEISHNREGFRAPMSRDHALAEFGLPGGYSWDRLLADTFAPGDLPLLAALVPILQTGSSNDQKLGAILAGIDTLSLPTLTQLERALLYGKDAKAPFGAKVDALPTKALREGPCARLMPALNALMQRIETARPRRQALLAVDRALVLHRFATVFLARLAAAKAARGWLDFDDLIERAGALLSDPSVAQWVLFRLDGGIDHILVDEAQDTSPGQWAVIERLSDEFTAGEGARGETRTIFVVGDRKQSIYSFQGADLQRFEAIQSHFSQKFAAIDRPLMTEVLEHSFRSSHAILQLVDLVFRAPAIEGLGGAPTHIAFRDTLPGRVDLWPVVSRPVAPETGNWEDPVDLRAESHESVLLARAIAAEIRAMIDRGVQIPVPEGARPVHEGDFLILVRKRSGLFAEIIRACKAAGLAIAGADRLKLGAELAVKDIRSVLAFLATPEDDLALAEALRSPLFGWSEQDLYRLAHPRTGYLWEALRHSDTRPATLEILQDLRDQADFLRPFELIDRLLTRHGGRLRLIARLGAEAEDGIDELMTQALSFERAEVPSLTGFLGWLETDNIEVKRQLEGGGQSIRVMTVHGAKGLEAPIVILPDTAKPRTPPLRTIYRTGDHAFWCSPRDEMPPPMAAAQDDLAEREYQEGMRLLYVALTRAEKWLIVATAGEQSPGGWYSLVADGLKTAGTETIEGLSPEARALGTIQRFAHGVWPEPGAPRVAPLRAGAVLPDWANRRAPLLTRADRPLSPSDLGGAKALPGEAATLDEAAAKRRGRQLHLLLEHLPLAPPPDWPELARQILSDPIDPPKDAEIEPLLHDVGRVLAMPEMARFLTPEALTEVELTATLPELGGRQIHGTIDRLVITPTQLHVLDYKSNAIVPVSAAQTPLGILRQMAAYRAALRQIYPRHQIVSQILWTAAPSLMTLGDAQLDAALRTATAS